MSLSITLRNVDLKYLTIEGETGALQGLNFEVAAEEFVGIIGPSGCGKSTLLSLVAGLLRPTNGEVLVGGRPVTGPSPRVGYMLQHDYLFEWRTIKKNVFIGLEVLGVKDPAMYDRALKLLASSGLRGFEDHYPYQLSGGMRQRAALVRTLATEPEVLLLDEPFSALDYQTRLYLEDEVYKTLRAKKKTVILVTHDLAEAIAMCDRVVVMSHRPGRVKAEHHIEFSVECGTPFQCRQAPEFRRYFRQIWEELEVNV
jgi:NitT/TauT family transport system ATP-binding protein